MKTRPKTRTRQVPVTIDGKTHHVTEQYTEHVPVPPRDWDHIVLTAVTAVTGAIVAASIVWSTASIGDLLAGAVVPAISYLAAVIFDLVWITCMAVEWLARYDDSRARAPRRAGHAALLIAMAAVGVHGALTDNLAVGIVGALVSALAKGTWTIVMKHHKVPLDDRTRAWLAQEQGILGAQLVIASKRQQALRVEGQLDAQRLALGITPPSPTAEPHPALPEAPAARHLAPPVHPAGTVGSRVLDIDALFGASHAPVIYFITNGDRVKIGTSQNLRRRVKQLCLRTDDIALVLHGDQAYEHELHGRFAAHRVGDTEWFRVAGDLADFITTTTGTAPRFTAPQDDASPAPHAAPHEAPSPAGDAPSPSQPLHLKPVPPLAARDEAAEQRAAVPLTLPSAASPDHGGAAHEALRVDGMSKADAVRHLRAADPEASPLQLVTRLAQLGVAVDASYVRTVLSRSRKPSDPGTGQYL